MKRQENSQLTRFGHSCVLLSVHTHARVVNLLIDPGNLTPTLTLPEPVDAVLITHAHPDHLDGNQFSHVTFAGAPRVLGAKGTAAALEEFEIQGVSELQPGPVDIEGVSVTAMGAPHEQIYPKVPVPENVAYLIDESILVPGDSFVLPQVPVDVLLLPLGAPWMKLSETIDYLNAVAPRIVIPVHDAGLAPAHQGLHLSLVQKFAPDGTTVVAPALGERILLAI